MGARRYRASSVGGSLALTRAEETRTDIEHWQSWYENGIDLLRRAGHDRALRGGRVGERLRTLYRVVPERRKSTKPPCSRPWRRERERRGLRLIMKFMHTNDDIRTRALLIRTYVREAADPFIVPAKATR